MSSSQTMTEKSYREELLTSQKYLALDKKGVKVMGALRTCYPEMSSAYILKYIPDQAEDFYEVMVDGASIVSIQVDRSNDGIEPIVVDLDFNRYLSDLSKTNRMKFMIAVDLASSP